MEIIIRTDEQGRPDAVDVSGPSGVGSVPEPPAAVALQAAALGAHNAGPAPTRPGTAGASSGGVAPAD